jgi:formate hydrogenlyase subunit 3/multisubunit Na+/H+ antiporter MnhD subunit
MVSALWLAPLLVPLVAAGIAPFVGSRRAGLLVLAPLPALVLAVTGEPGPPPDLPWLLLDLRLGLTGAGRVLLLTTALVWVVGGIAAHGLAVASRSATVLWLVTLTGNVGVVLAADVVTLYTAYAVMTFAAYGLVVHDRSDASRRAGRVYVVMAVLSEVLLLAGLLLAVGAADGATGTAQVASSLADAADRGVIVGLLLAGFAVKAGIVPLHVWLPLAHPAAPIPASAVLSGAMIKAGLVGWLQVLPLGEVAFPAWGSVVVVVGLTTALSGAALALSQVRAKAVLAYSSISQMGIIAALVGIGLLVPGAAPLAVTAAVVYALHHGLAKAALFLAVGVWRVPMASWRRRIVVAGTVLAGLALAGAPLTSGWVAKAGMKDVVDAVPGPLGGRVTAVLALAAVGTTLVMARFLAVLARGPVIDPRPVSVGERALAAGWAVAVAAVTSVVWVLPVWLLPSFAAPAVTPGGLVDGAWPVVAGTVVAAVLLWRRPIAEAPRVPPGDLVVGVEAFARRLGAVVGVALDAGVSVRGRVAAVAVAVQRSFRPGEGFARLDRALTRWRVAGVVFVTIGAALVLTLSRQGG